jgi:hypothetical protein
VIAHIPWRWARNRSIRFDLGELCYVTPYNYCILTLAGQQTLWLLANDTQSQCRLREELAPITEQNAHPDPRTLKDLKWLDCVV